MKKEFNLSEKKVKILLMDKEKIQGKMEVPLTKGFLKIIRKWLSKELKIMDEITEDYTLTKK